MHTVKQYNTKLARLRSTRKMTKTMKMVSANKLRKAQDAQRNVTQYMSRLDDVTARLAEHADPDSHPLLCPRSPAKNILMVVIASDRGLCGGFNNNLNKKVLEWISDARKLGNNVELSVYGRRALLFFKNRMKIREHSEDVTGRPRFADAFWSGRIGWGNTITNDRPVVRIDQVWTSDHFQPTAVFARETLNSDHRMVVCDLRLQDDAAE